MKTISDEILNFLLDNSESMISIINDRLEYEHVNEAFCRNLKTDKSEMVGKSPSRLWGDETYRDKIKDNIRRSLNGEKVQYRAYFDISGEGGRFYEVTYRPFRSDRKKVNFAVVETRDVSSEIDDRLEDAGKEEKYLFMEKFLPFGIFSCDRDSVVIDANHAFYNITELESGKSNKLSDLFSVDQRFISFINSAKHGEAGTFGQVQMKTGKDRELFTRISCYIHKSEDGEVIVDGILEDTTREVIMERRLYQSHRLETLGTLAGGVAHDFNTILTTISGYSDMALSEVEINSSVYKYIMRLKSAVDKAENIINQMLVFSKRFDQQLVDLEIEDVLSEAVDFLSSSIQGNINLETDIKPVNRSVNADPTQLFRVFLNIMTNALHAMKDQGGTLSVCCKKSVIDNREFADVVIGDTGSGIDISIIDRIFEPFFTTKDVDKGTGMGLAVAHGIITGIGGEIDVASTPGKGSVFTVRIPLQHKNNDTSSAGAEKKKNILFVHSNMHLSRTLSQALEKMGYSVTLLSSETDIESILKNKPGEYDVLFISNDFVNEEISRHLTEPGTRVRDLNVVIILPVEGKGDNDRVIYFKKSGFNIIREPLNLRDIIKII